MPGRMRTFFVAVVVALVLLPTALARAQPAPAPSFEKKGDVADVKDVKAVTWTATGEAGVVSTTGNSRTTTLTASANATRKDKDNKLDLTVTGTYARATTRIAADTNGDGLIEPDELTSQTATSAKNAAGKLRYDRYLTAQNSLYIAALAGFDDPAGKAFVGGGQIGYSRALYDSKRQQLLGEVGYDLSYIKLSAGSSTTVHSGRLFAGYQVTVRETQLTASVEALINGNRITYGTRSAGAFDGTRVVGIVGATTALSTKLSLNVSFTMKYDNFPAPLPEFGMTPFAPGFVPVADSLDTITKISLILKVL